MDDKINKAINEISDINDKGGKGTEKINGKTYTKFSTRVEVFRKHLGLEYGIDTDFKFGQSGVIVSAKIKKGADVIGSGHAYTSNINQNKSFEKLESTAIGRALGSIGLIGGEYASEHEIESWADRYDKPSNPGIDEDKQKSFEVAQKIQDQIKVIRSLKSPGAVSNYVKENPIQGMIEKQAERYDELIKEHISMLATPVLEATE